MRLTKMTHSCVRLENDGFTVSLDPGSLSEAGAADGADAIFITHEHFDHLDEQRLASAARSTPGVQLWTCRSVAAKLDGIPVPVHVVGHGDAFEVGGLSVQVHGERHEITHPDQPPVQNSGFLISGPSTAAGGSAGQHTIFHPGDAFTVPGAPVGTLLTPASAPWLKVPEVIEYVREIAPRRAYAIHEALLNDAGLGLVDGMMAGLAAERGGDNGEEIRRLSPGQTVAL